MIQFRDYQNDIIAKGTEVIRDHGFLYLAMEVRTGKTLTSLGIVDKVGATNALFITKKKAMQSIIEDYDNLKPNFPLYVINYESLHKLPKLNWDMVICDEAHTMGAFPKPSKRAKQVSEIVFKCNSKVIFLSGTPTPESFSQMYHQVYSLRKNPFSHHKSFYKFASEFVNVFQRKIGSHMINDYSRGSAKILDVMQPYMISYSQKEAGFKVETKETVLHCAMSKETYDLANRLKKDLVIEGSEEIILADTAVKLMSKLHQIYSGTVKFESGNSMVIDLSKGQFIKKKFDGKKIGIFYKFKEELNVLKKVYKDDLTTDLEEFNTTDKNIALQIVSGREGISLRQADCLVFFNIDFSATSYWQARDRMSTKDRLHNQVYWIFSIDGIESDIYKAVSKKKNYTVRHFKREFLNL
tara:strand:- start:7707 stop:8939 length:1233 start_codon:yes stop_codon:yes gene_type:complete